MQPSKQMTDDTIARNPMGYAIGAGLVLLVVAGIIFLVTGGNRYAQMTEREFEEEARRGSALGGALLEIQKVFDPKNKVEYIQQRDKHAEGDRANSGEGSAGDAREPQA